MRALFETIPLHAINVEPLIVGQHDSFEDGYTLRTISPLSGVAQPLQGRYEYTCQGRAEDVGPGEILITRANIPFTLVHHGDLEQDGFMKARWVQFRFTIFASIDLMSFLVLPVKAGREYADSLSALIAEAQQPAPREEVAALRWHVRRKVLAFEILQILCELAELKPNAREFMRTVKRMPIKGDNYGSFLGSLITDALMDVPTRAERTSAALREKKERAVETLAMLSDLATSTKKGVQFLCDLEQLSSVFTFIQAHLAEHISVEDLAREAGMSISRFHVFFRAYMSSTPMEYVKRVRIEDAARQLDLTDLSIGEIARAVGFANQYHFSREFKTHFGDAPSAYRNSIRHNRLPASQAREEAEAYDGPA